MKLKVIVHEESRYRAQGPAIPDFVAQTKSRAELLKNLHVAVEGCPFVLTHA
jgi:predicted RNase H-like HicB family nuclease